MREHSTNLASFRRALPLTSDPLNALHSCSLSITTSGFGHRKLSEKANVVFIHGWAGSAKYWKSTANALADQFDCLLYDMRGWAIAWARTQIYN